MSVIFTPRARFSRWKALWPLALAGGVILLAAAGVMWLSAVPAGGGIRPF